MYKKPLIYLVAITAIARLVTASLLELGNDEVYYYTYALHLQSNYFDHPPGVALMIRVFTLNLLLQQEVFIRLGAIVFAAIGTVLAFKIGKLLQNERAGWYAAILYNSCLYSSILAGLFILPDSPQIVFWLSSLYIMLIIARKTFHHQQISILFWIAFGVSNGLCIMCKIHGVFLWLGFVFYAILYERQLFFRKGFYVAIIITAAFISPILFWNIQNHFVTWNYHSNRVGGTHFDKDTFLQAFFGQIFYNNPINTILIIGSIISLSKRNFFENKFYKLLLLCGLPMIIVVTLMSLVNKVLPHWSGPGFLSLSFIAAVYLEKRSTLKNIFSLPLVLKSSSALTAGLIILGVLIINFYPGTIGSKNKDTYGEYDFTLDMYGWEKFDYDFKEWCRQEENVHLFSPSIKIVCNKWFPAAHIDYYVARSIPTAVIGEGTLGDLHHYLWLNNYRPPILLKENALCIVPSNCPSNPALDYQACFDKITLVKTFTEYRTKTLCRYFKIYLLEGFKKKYQSK